jgi:hypothetical protein
MLGVNDVEASDIVQNTARVLKWTTSVYLISVWCNGFFLWAVLVLIFKQFAPSGCLVLVSCQDLRHLLSRTTDSLRDNLEEFRQVTLLFKCFWPTICRGNLLEWGKGMCLSLVRNSASYCNDSSCGGTSGFMFRVWMQFWCNVRVLNHSQLWITQC